MSSIWRLYDEIMAQADPLCENFPLMGSPFVVFSIIALYLVIVWKGPKWMEPYKAWELKYTLVFYNFFLVALSLYISIETLISISKAGGYSVMFFAVEKTRLHENREIHAVIGWLFFMSKIIEFLDTVFFIVRKKNSQLTFLHVYHHATMTVFTWLGLKFLPGGSNVMYPLLNSLVHAIMYTYYGLSALGPSVKKYLWWKEYLTRIQIVQFLIFLLQDAINIIYKHPLPKVFAYPAYMYNISILILFLKFYTKSYSRAAVFRLRKNSNKPTENGSAKNGEITANGDYKKID